MERGWIKIWRKMLDNFLYPKNRPFTKFEAWLDILLQVNHQETKILLDNKPFTITEGCMVTSIKALSERWKWSRHKISNFLELLENENQIVQKRDTKRTYLNVLNYDTYNSRGTQKGHQKDIKRTSKGHQKDTNKNNKNDKNKEKINKKKFLDLVYLTEEEYQKLVDRFGKLEIDSEIENLDIWFSENPTKYKNSKSHYKRLIAFCKRKNIPDKKKALKTHISRQTVNESQEQEKRLKSLFFGQITSKRIADYILDNPSDEQKVNEILTDKYSNLKRGINDYVKQERSKFTQAISKITKKIPRSADKSPAEFLNSNK